jgi:hypothetical protein
MSIFRALGTNSWPCHVTAAKSMAMCINLFKNDVQLQRPAMCATCLQPLACLEHEHDGGRPTLTGCCEVYSWRQPGQGACRRTALEAPARRARVCSSSTTGWPSWRPLTLVGVGRRGSQDIWVYNLGGDVLQSSQTSWATEQPPMPRRARDMTRWAEMGALGTRPIRLPPLGR